MYFNSKYVQRMKRNKENMSQCNNKEDLSMCKNVETKNNNILFNVC